MSARDKILSHPGLLATADAEIAALLDEHRNEAIAKVADVVDEKLADEPDHNRASTLYEVLLQLRGMLPCTCARSQGLHEKSCRKYVPGHELLSPVNALVAYRAEAGEKGSREADATPELTVYRASHESIIFGHYTTSAAAREHCEAYIHRELPSVSLDWIEDEEDGVAELVAAVGDEEHPTGYIVTALTVASAYDEEADE